MTFKSPKFLASIALLVFVGAVFTLKVTVSFRPGNASAYDEPSCTDGVSRCGTFGAAQVGTVSCSINGRAENGWTATCDTGDNITLAGGPGQQEWLVYSKSGSAVVPSTHSGDSNYNGGPIFPGSQVFVTWGANQAGSVSIGNVSDSNDPCSPYAIGKSSCNGFSGRSVTGLASPGDRLNMTVTMLHSDNNMSSGCNPGSSCGQWASGTASAEIENATYCYSSNNSQSPWIDPNNTTLGRRNYVATSQGVCSPDNLPAASSLKIPALSAKWSDNNSTSKTISVTPGQTYTIPLKFWNSGEAGSIVHVLRCDATKTGNVSLDIPNCLPTDLTGQ